MVHDKNFRKDYFKFENLRLNAPVWSYSHEEGLCISKIVGLNMRNGEISIRLQYRRAGIMDEIVGYKNFKLLYDNLIDCIDDFIIKDGTIYFINYHLYFKFIVNFIGIDICKYELKDLCPTSNKVENYDFIFDFNENEYKKYDKYFKE